MTVVPSMTKEAFVSTLLTYKGIVEVPSHSNMTPIGREFGWNGVSWCAMTQSLALCGAHYDPASQTFTYRDGFWDGSKITLPGADFRKGWAAVPSILAAFQRQGWTGRVPKYPCLIAFRWSADPMDSHIGAAIRPGTVVTFEGNHNDRFEQWARDETNQVWAYLYPPWSEQDSGLLTPWEYDMPAIPIGPVTNQSRIDPDPGPPAGPGKPPVRPAGVPYERGSVRLYGKGTIDITCDLAPKTSAGADCRLAVGHEGDFRVDERWVGATPWSVPYDESKGDVQAVCTIYGLTAGDVTLNVNRTG